MNFSGDMVPVQQRVSRLEMRRELRAHMEQTSLIELFDEFDVFLETAGVLLRTPAVCRVSRMT